MLEKVWKKGILLHCQQECKLLQSLWRTVWRFLKKQKIESPYDPEIQLLGIYLEKTIIQKDTCTPVFIATLFTKARTWQQPKCPSTDEWIKKAFKNLLKTSFKQYVMLCYIYILNTLVNRDSHDNISLASQILS